MSNAPHSCSLVRVGNTVAWALGLNQSRKEAPRVSNKSGWVGTGKVSRVYSFITEFVVYKCFFRIDVRGRGMIFDLEAFG